MKLDRDIMVDLETLATSPNATILTIAGVRFNFNREYRNIENPYDMDYFYCRVDPERILKLKLLVLKIGSALKTLCLHSTIGLLEQIVIGPMVQHSTFLF